MGRTEAPLPDWDGTASNFVFLGGAGSGKSEIAVNAALRLAGQRERAVRFFDLDMTKPLFRSRVLAGQLEAAGVIVRYEEQFMDAPVTVGGPEVWLRRNDCLCVLDVGGDGVGARSVGQYASLLRSEAAAVYYVINPYRPWSDTTEHIDAILSEILSAAHLSLDNLRLVGNPNLGPETTEEEFLEGCRMLEETVAPYRPISFVCARSGLEASSPWPVMELTPLLSYPWNDGPPET